MLFVVVRVAVGVINVVMVIRVVVYITDDMFVVYDRVYVVVVVVVVVVPTYIYIYIYIYIYLSIYIYIYIYIFFFYEIDVVVGGCTGVGADVGAVIRCFRVYVVAVRSCITYYGC